MRNIPDEPFLPTWWICLGLLAASAAVATIAVLVWLVFGSNTMLVLGIISGLLLGLDGVLQLLRRLDRAASQLRRETAGSAVTQPQAV